MKGEKDLHIGDSESIFIPLREYPDRKVVGESEEVSLRRDSAPDEALGEDTLPPVLGSFIDPARKQEYLGILDQAFDAWHKKEWFFVTKEYFTTISRAFFLSYLRYLVSASDEKGRIDLTATKAGLAEEMGEYFRQEKLDNALGFLKEGDWQGLIQK